jgi:PBP1b-binding outer membrane lipoprotein LpoB
MKKFAIAAAVVLFVGGCAHKPSDQPKQQVSRTMKADKRAPQKTAVPVEAATPNETVKKRWYDRFLKHKSK